MKLPAALRERIPLSRFEANPGVSPEEARPAFRESNALWNRLFGFCDGPPDIEDKLPVKLASRKGNQRGRQASKAACPPAEVLADGLEVIKNGWRTPNMGGGARCGGKLP